MTTGAPLGRSAPEAQGIPSGAITAFLAAAERQIHDLHSMVLVRHGQVVAQGWWAPYAPERPHMLFSLSKSFTSTAVGLAAAEGLLSLDDPVLAFFPEEAPADVSEHLAAMRVRHLLSMSTGHVEDTLPAVMRGEQDWARVFLAQPVEREPGTHFVYNSGATYMLSAIVQRRSGVRLLEYLRPRLLEPLGITSAAWEQCPRGVDTGGWGLSVTTDAIARFGQLYLQRGVWQGRQLLPKGWVEQASARHVSNGNSPESDWEQGYGFQFWRCRHGAYRGDGAFGQFCVVMPEQEAVLAITAGVGDMQAVLNLAWEHLLPAMGDAPLAEDRAAHGELERTLAALALAPQHGRPSSPRAAQVSGQTFSFAPNELGVQSARLTLADDGAVLAIRDGRGEHQVAAAFGSWRAGETTLDWRGRLACVASGAWTEEDTYVTRVCFVETPFIATATLRFVGDELLLDYRQNVGFGPQELPRLRGKQA